MNAILRVVVVIALVVCAGAASAAGLAVKVREIVRKAPTYELTVKYPQTGVAVIDAEIAAWAKARADDFVAYVKHDRLPEQGDGPWSLEISFKVVRNDAQMFEVLFSHRRNDDGNHTHFDFTTFDYLMPGAYRVFIPEVVTPAAFGPMRAYAAAHMVSEDPDFGAEATEGSLHPEADTFAAFTISPSAITVWFTPEQLENMTSAGGHAVIPIAALKGVVRANWRAPQPSFDCAKAATAVEKAVCSDVALARRDREMARVYRLLLHSGMQGLDPAGELKEEQRDWVAGLRRDCPAGASHAEMISCLMREYDVRIDQLSRHR